jgi:hypothetical protein
MGMIEAQPGRPALVNTFHIATITNKAISNSAINTAGLGAWPCDEDEYSTCASNDRGFCISDIIWVKGLKAQVYRGASLWASKIFEPFFYTVPSVNLRASGANEYV